MNNKKFLIYDMVNENDYLFISCSNVVAGFIGFGFPGAVAGLTVGIADELLVKSKYLDSHYLSTILQGMSSFATLSTSWAIRGLGGFINLSFFKFTLNTDSMYGNKIIFPVQNGLQLGYVFGIQGVIAGVCLGAIEEVFIGCDFYNKHYIGNSFYYFSSIYLINNKFGESIASLFSKNSQFKKVIDLLSVLYEKHPYLCKFTSLLIGTAQSVYLAEKDDNVEILDIQKNIKQVFYTLNKQDEYIKILENQILTISGLLVAEQFFYFKLIDHFQKNNEAFYGEIIKLNIWDKFKVSSKNIFVTLAALILIKQIFINPIESYFGLRLKNLLYDTLNKKWLKGDMPLKLLKNEGVEVLIDNLNRDMDIIVIEGEGLRKSLFNDITKNSYSQYLLYQYNSQDLIVYYSIYYAVTRYFSEKLSKLQQSYIEEVRYLESKKNMLIKHDIRNAETVVERDGFIYTEAKLKEINDEIKSVLTIQLMLQHIHETWEEVEKYTDAAITSVLVGYKSFIGEINQDLRLKVVMATGSVTSLMSWKGRNSITIEKVKNSISKINSFIHQIDYVDNFSQSLKRVVHSKNELLIEDFNLYIGNHSLFSIENIKLIPGVYYALTGNSGSGKSSFFSKIKGIVYNDIEASGIMKFPYNVDIDKDIILMSQKDYFPVNVTLTEAIYYPRVVNNDEKKSINDKIYNFLNKLDICNNVEGYNTCHLYDFMKDIKDWNSVLSGGQKKKVLLTSVLLHNPKILLLDEPFTGLHKKAIIDMQSLIRETLNDSIIICIDHHLSDNKNFYNYELNIMDNSLKLKQLNYVKSAEFEDNNQCFLGENKYFHFLSEHDQLCYD